MSRPASGRPRAAGPPPVLGRGPLAPVPERAAAGRPGRAEQPRSSRSCWRARYLAYDVAISRGAALPGGDLRVAFVALVVAVVLVTGSVVTYLVVPQPRGSGDRAPADRRGAPRSGFFAAVPICYLVLVVAVQVLKPLLD